MLKQLWILLALPLAGCFPIELDVSKDGKVLIARQEGYFLFDPAAGKTVRIRGAGNDAPVFARLSPDGKRFLAVEKLKSGFNEFRFVTSNLDGSGAKEIYRAKQTTYVSYSPDGKLLAVTRVADKEKPPLDQAAPQLQVMTTEGKQERQLGSNMGPLFRWFPDSQRLLAFQIKTKDKEGGDYFGQLVVVDVASGKQTALAEVQTDQQMFFDLSPDGKEAMLTARIAANAGARLPKTEAFENSLYRVDVDKRTVTETTRDKATDFAIYSPDGKHVLIGEETDGFDFTGQQITIADPQLGTFTTVARDAHKSMSIGGEGIVYPVWYDDKTILYFVERANYGTEGKSLSLTMVGVDGENKKCVQPLIDLVAVQSP